MAQTSDCKSQGQLGSLLVSALLILVGMVTLWDTLDYSDRDSQVFPQTVAIILIITAAISLLMRKLKPSNEGGFGHGIWWRRVLLIASLFLTCFLMPQVGFLIASVAAFAGGLISAMHDRWTVKNSLLYAISGALIMLAFYMLFKYALHVPLP